jgi:hypothetical protein
MGFCHDARRPENCENGQPIRPQGRSVRGSQSGDKAISDALSWTHPWELEEQKLAPRTVIYTIEAVNFMQMVKTGQQNTLPPDYLHIGTAVAQACDVRASRAKFRLCNYEKALEVNPECSTRLPPAHPGRWTRTSQSTRTPRG